MSAISQKGKLGKSLFISVLRFFSAEHAVIIIFNLFLALLKHLCMLSKIFFLGFSSLINSQQQPQWNELCNIIIISISKDKKTEGLRGKLPRVTSRGSRTETHPTHNNFKLNLLTTYYPSSFQKLVTDQKISPLWG